MSTNIESKQIVFLGAGKMGEAMLNGWLSSDTPPAQSLSSSNFSIVEHTEKRCNYLSQNYKVQCFSHVFEPTQADIVILAVKPQGLCALVKTLAGLEQYQSSLFVSIAAGISTDTLTQLLPEKSRLVRVMPNVGLMVGAGASVVCSSSSSTKADVQLVYELFACLGQAEIIEEKFVDAAGALSGSGPAYIAAVVEAMVQAGQQQGLSPELSESLTLQTLYGSALQLKTTGQSAQALRESVSSPGGTTLAALAAMKNAGLENVFSQGVAAAVQRSKELATCQP